MDWAQFSEMVLTGALGAGIVKLMDLAVDRFRQAQRRKEEKVNKLLAYLNELGELASLYGFYLEIVNREKLALDSRFEKAIEALQGVDLNSTIDQKIVKIRLMSEAAHDLARELDPESKLDQKLKELYWLTLAGAYLARDKALTGLGNCLEAANQARVEIRSVLQEHMG